MDFHGALCCLTYCHSLNAQGFAPSFVVSSAEIEVVADFAVLLGRGIASPAYSPYWGHSGNWMDFACPAYEEAQTYWEVTHNQDSQRNLDFDCLGSYQTSLLQETCQDACQEEANLVAGGFEAAVGQGPTYEKDA